MVPFLEVAYVKTLMQSELRAYLNDILVYRTICLKEEWNPCLTFNMAIYGTQDVTDSLKDRYSASRFNQGVPLTEPVQVGPGLGQLLQNRPVVSNKENTRKYAQTPNVDELRVKTNPKTTYEGRVIDSFKVTEEG